MLVWISTATALSSFCVTYTSLVVYAAVFGATIGAYVGLTSVVLVDLLGLQKLTNAFGLVLMFQGIASLAGPPIAGKHSILIFLCTVKFEWNICVFRSFEGYYKLVRSCLLRGWCYDRHQWFDAVRHSSITTLFGEIQSTR